MAGAALGFLYGGPEQTSVGDLLKRYNLRLSDVYIFIIDIIIYCLLGPIIVFSMYNPVVVIQAVTLGIGWPLVVRGLTKSMPAPTAQNQSESQK